MSGDGDRCMTIGTALPTCGDSRSQIGTCDESSRPCARYHCDYRRIHCINDYARNEHHDFPGAVGQALTDVPLSRLSATAVAGMPSSRRYDRVASSLPVRMTEHLDVSATFTRLAPEAPESRCICQLCQKKVGTKMFGRQHIR